MIRVGFLDTTVQGYPGSMLRFREQLANVLSDCYGDQVCTETLFLGLDRSVFDATPARVRMWRHHLSCYQVARNLKVDDFDALHLLDGSFGYVAGVVQHPRVITTVHDVIPALQMHGLFEQAPPIRRGARWLITRSLSGVSKAAAVCTVSRNTAEDLGRVGCRLTGDLTVVPMAIETELFSGAGSKSSGEYVFHIGNNGFYKNRIGVLEVFRRITRPNLRLVLAGPEPDDAVKEFARRHRLSERIEYRIAPTQSDLRELYSNASALIFPSLYEGFGWPPLEAMSAGCPVVCSDAGSLAEVVGDAAIVAESGDYEAMARAVEQILADEPTRGNLIRKGHDRVAQFSPKRLATSMYGVYSNVCRSPQGVAA